MGKSTINHHFPWFLYVYQRVTRVVFFPVRKASDSRRVDVNMCGSLGTMFSDKGHLWLVQLVRPPSDVSWLTKAQ
jgi:hypothetical protein